MKFESNTTLDILHLLIKERNPERVWAALIANGRIVCMTCAHTHYPNIYRATLNPSPNTSEWRVIGFINSDWHQDLRICSLCTQTLWV